MKAPYTANNMHYHGRTLKTLQEIIHELKAAIDKEIGSTFPYLILQPTIPNRKEYKVILHDGTCKYFNQLGDNKYYSPRLNSPAAKEVMQFAELVYNTIKQRQTIDQRLILDGLFRIDIMKLETESGGHNIFVVNELEGVDSNYSSKDPVHEASTRTFLQQHWKKIISDKLEKLMQ
jgi:hypothetical protein